MTTVRCPNCEATYKVDPAKLAGGGRKLRCAQCQTVWLATAEAAAEDAPAPVDDVPVPAPDNGPADADKIEEAPAEGDAAFAPDHDDMVVQRTPGVDAVVRVGGWRQWVRGENKWRTAALGVVLAGLATGGLVVWMNLQGADVAAPASDFALPVGEVSSTVAFASDVVKPPAGIVLHRVRGEVSEVDGDGGGMALTVRGLLANTTSQTITVPPMRLELLGKDGSVADMWPVSGVAARMEPGAEEAWTVSLSAPDMTAVQGWRVVFVAE